MRQLFSIAIFNGQIERTSLLNIVIRIKEKIVLREFLLLKVYREQFLLIRIYDIGVCSLIFVTDKVLIAKRIYQDFVM